VLPDSSLKARLLGANPLHVWASPAYLRAKGRPKTPDELTAHEVLASANDAKSWGFVVKSKKVAVPVKARVVVNSFVLLRQLTEAGLGLSRLPLELCRVAEEQGRVVRVLDTFALPPVPLHAVYPASAQLSPRLRVFLDYLEQHLPLRRA
jgi:DNA-binding transcriptional LysR family regulator